MTTLNLDQKAAQYAQKIISEGQQAGQPKEIENLITKTLGVLQEQGVYAMMLFLFSRTSKERAIAPHIRAQLYQLLAQLPVFDDEGKRKIPNTDADAQMVLKFYSDTVCNDLDTLLLVKELYEQTLIYTRYGAKATAKETN